MYYACAYESGRTAGQKLCRMLQALQQPEDIQERSIDPCVRINRRFLNIFLLFQRLQRAAFDIVFPPLYVPIRMHKHNPHVRVFKMYTFGCMVCSGTTNMQHATTASQCWQRSFIICCTVWCAETAAYLCL
jgi:hypothetical protein